MATATIPTPKPVGNQPNVDAPSAPAAAPLRQPRQRTRMKGYRSNQPTPQHIIDRNRTNSEKSTGPRTVSGKRRSSMNALKFGVFSETVLLPDDDKARYDALTADLAKGYKPVGPSEVACLARIRDLQWQFNRAQAQLEYISIHGPELRKNELASYDDRPELQLALARTLNIEKNAKTIFGLHRLCDKFGKEIAQFSQRFNELQHERRTRLQPEALPQPDPKNEATSAPPQRVKSQPSSAVNQTKQAPGIDFNSFDYSLYWRQALEQRSQMRHSETSNTDDNLYSRYIAELTKAL